MPEARRARSGDGSSYGGVGFRVFWGIQKSHYSPANFNDSAFILGMTVFAQDVLKPQQRGPKPQPSTLYRQTFAFPHRQTDQQNAGGPQRSISTSEL